MDLSFLNKLSEKDIDKLRMLISLNALTQPANNLTLRLFSEEYSVYINANRSKAYHKSVQNSFKHLVDYFSNQKLIHTISLKETEIFISYLQRIVKKGFRVYYRTLKAAFNKAVDWGYIKENHFLKVKLPKMQKINPHFISISELQIILKKIESPTIRDIVTIAFFTGLRLSELVNLRWGNVNLTNNIITVGDENFITKGRDQRYIPICNEAFQIFTNRRLKIQNSLDKQHYVFTKSNDFPYTGDFISKKFKAACKKVGMDNSIHFHTLRHSFASNLAQNGVSLYVIKELLGHSSITTTEIYSHLNIKSLKEAINTFNYNYSN